MSAVMDICRYSTPCMKSTKNYGMLSVLSVIFLYSEHKEFEVLEDSPCSDENGYTIGYSYTFTYKDKNTGAFGYYEIEISEEYITHKKSPN